jgi:hypothetical protein
MENCGIIEPKEKAIEMFEEMKGFRVKHSHAKKCVRKAIAQIIASNPTLQGNTEDLVTMIVQAKCYWCQVEDELAKL